MANGPSSNRRGCSAPTRWPTGSAPTLVAPMNHTSRFPTRQHDHALGRCTSRGKGRCSNTWLVSRRIPDARESCKAENGGIGWRALSSPHHHATKRITTYHTVTEHPENPLSLPCAEGKMCHAHVVVEARRYGRARWLAQSPRRPPYDLRTSAPRQHRP